MKSTSAALHRKQLRLIVDNTEARISHRLGIGHCSNFESLGHYTGDVSLLKDSFVSKNESSLNLGGEVSVQHEILYSVLEQLNWKQHTVLVRFGGLWATDCGTDLVHTCKKIHYESRTALTSSTAPASESCAPLSERGASPTSTTLCQAQAVACTVLYPQLQQSVLQTGLLYCCETQCWVAPRVMHRQDR